MAVPNLPPGTARCRCAAMCSRRLFYRSANFDEDVFDDPQRFDILRDPNPHLGFGGTGAHYCVGANLARMTIDLMFNAIADHLPDLTPVAEPERLRSSMINGIKHWQGAHGRTVRTPCAY